MIKFFLNDCKKGVAKCGEFTQVEKHAPDA